ncbi:MAG: hypothetical protein AB1798_16985 [Spirochaetota bacterium]
MEALKNTLQSAVSECDTHIQKLQRGRKLLKSLFPLSVEIFQNLNEEQIEHIDQFIYRFIKLQDSMGTRLLPALFTYVEGDDRPRPF